MVFQMFHGEERRKIPKHHGIWAAEPPSAVLLFLPTEAFGTTLQATVLVIKELLHLWKSKSGPFSLGFQAFSKHLFPPGKKQGKHLRLEKHMLLPRETNPQWKMMALVSLIKPFAPGWMRGSPSVCADLGCTSQ